MCFRLTVSLHEVRAEAVPALRPGKHWVVVAEMIVGDQGVFGVPEDHQHLQHSKVQCDRQEGRPGEEADDSLKTPLCPVLVLQNQRTDRLTLVFFS